MFTQDDFAYKKNPIIAIEGERSKNTFGFGNLIIIYEARISFMNNASQAHAWKRYNYLNFRIKIKHKKQDWMNKDLKIIKILIAKREETEKDN